MGPVLVFPTASHSEMGDGKYQAGPALGYITVNMNIHFHTLVLDGVFTEAPGGAMTCHPAPAPSDAEVAAALVTIRHRVQRLQVRHGPA